MCRRCALRSRSRNPINQDPTETVSGAPRNWKGIGIAVLVISVILSLVILSISLLTPEDESPDPRPRLTLDDIWAPKFQIHDPEVKWINGDTVIMRTPEGHVIKQSMTTREITLLLENRIFVSLEATKYKVSPNLLYILLASNVTEVYRYSYTATYSICCVQTKSCSELRVPGVGGAQLQFAGWGARGSQLVYIFENNIYYQQSQTSVAQRLTSSGTEGVVYNGIADWLYEEEVLGTSAAHWCSPDGAWLTFAQINDTLVPKMEIPRYLGQLYPRAKIYPYPKMRQPLPSVSLFLVKLYGSAHTLQILPPESLRFSQYYVTMVSWVSNTSLAVRWLNRAQNVSLLTRCEVTTGACVEKHKISSDGWLSKQGEQLLFSPDGSTFFLTVPTQQGAGGRFWHLARFTARAQHTGEESHFITSGSFDVTSLFAYDERSQRIYFESSEEAPTTRHLYSASLSGSLHRQCLTCGLLPDCTWPRVQLSPGLSHFLLSCYGSGVPTHSVHRVADPRDFFLLTDNQDLREAVKNRQMPLTKLHTLAGGTRIRADSVSRSGSSWTGGLS
ncbi:inactive dipeptidyl peptidase 10-like isoform X1 [Hypanus sabinus]|uniref:inactive dipeptidyl peptidase 10-like isoform X1 n=3 Tax=Hypanus sabinus TaxID=79690 RepID=UPI0028C3E497|nr:inactive dipeptidyl peptidase 10-like isoform X1 [Hypanus sabinus]XP_059812261.1 inactive dipeptidyl peptidase 10-like isoform X1 [Hypanus sabinus]